MPLVKIDFSEASSVGQFRPRAVEDGEYPFVIKSSELTESSNKTPMVVLTLTSPKIPGATYPLYCMLSGKGVFRLRQVMEAVGFNTGDKSVVNFNTDKLHGRKLGGVLLQEEYKDNLQSKIDSVMSLDELDGLNDEIEADPTDGDSEPLSKAAVKRKPTSVENDDSLDVNIEEI